MLLLAQFDVVLDMMPASDHYQTDDLPALLCRCRRNCFIQLGDQLKHRLNALITQGRIIILDFTEQSIGEHDLQNRLEDMTGAIVLSFNQLRHGTHVLELTIPHDRQIIAQNAGKLRQNPILNVSILQDICNEGCDLHRKLQILRIQFDILPEVPLIGSIPGGLQIRRCRIPLVFGQVVHVGLLGQKIRIQHVAQLMGKQA